MKGTTISEDQGRELDEKAPKPGMKFLCLGKRALSTFQPMRTSWASFPSATPIMSDLPPQLISNYDGAPIGSGTEASAEREKRREAERDALVSDTHQREASLLEDTQQLFTHLSAYLRGELSSTNLSRDPSLLAGENSAGFLPLLLLFRHLTLSSTAQSLLNSNYGGVQTVGEDESSNS